MLAVADAVQEKRHLSGEEAVEIIERAIAGGEKVMKEPTMTMTMVTTSQLDEAESTIERAGEDARRSLLEVGSALQTIRDERLYAGRYHDFDSYCRERWGWSRIHAHRMIDAARVTALLPIGNTPVPVIESHARELRRLESEPEKMAAAWQEANGWAEESGQKVTAEMVKVAVAERLPERDTSLPGRSRSSV